MSPLPERIAESTAFVNNREGAIVYLEEKIDADKIWRVLPVLKDPQESRKLLKSMGVDFDLPLVPLESYKTYKDKSGLIFHRVYVTNKKGVYLELQTRDQDKFKFPIKIESVEQIIFHKLGKEENDKYLGSITI
jgi:hypothetical protein